MRMNAALISCLSLGEWARLAKDPRTGVGEH